MIVFILQSAGFFKIALTSENLGEEKLIGIC